jgi:hypothetical protein
MQLIIYMIDFLYPKLYMFNKERHYLIYVDLYLISVQMLLGSTLALNEPTAFRIGYVSSGRLVASHWSHVCIITEHNLIAI